MIGLDNMLRINEIFKSILGESTYAGNLCSLIRLSGCNLNCRYCDTRYAQDEFSLCSLEEIIERVRQYKVPLVLVTGGEPLLQEKSCLLMDRLLKEGYQVLLETNGSLGVENVPKGVVKIVDIKCPGSGEDKRMDWKNLDYLTPADEIKLVISNQLDLEWATSLVMERHLDKLATVLFSPVSGSIEPPILADWMIEQNVPARLQLQMHKIIWGEVRGK